MYRDKRVLLIGGGGTLGTYVGKELLSLGAYVDVLCPEEKTSEDERLIFIQGRGTQELLTELFAKCRYDGIVNFIHYREPEEYKAIHPLLIGNTSHLIFLSSYRVYADLEHPITESAPQLYKVVDNESFFATERYAYPKSVCEDYLRDERAGESWTIVRPVISSSQRRLDLLNYSGHMILDASDSGTELLLPDYALNLHAGFDWAGNSGKLIARLLFKPEAIGEAFTVYSGHGLTWGEVAEIYKRLTGVRTRVCNESEYLEANERLKTDWSYWYDRKFDRLIDCSKIMRVTGLTSSDFTPVEVGLQIELDKLGWKRKVI